MSGVGGRFRTGTKADVLRMMASFAIRDQEALIDAYTPRFGAPDSEAVQVISKAKDAIADFRRLAASLSPTSTTKAPL